MTDPIADMLTRIRNAVHARHQRVDVPASRFKAEIAQDPRAGRLHPGLQARDATTAAAQRPADSHRAQVRPARRERHLRARAREPAGPPRLSRPRRRAEGHGRARHQHPDDVARRHDRARTPSRPASAAKCSATSGKATRILRCLELARNPSQCRRASRSRVHADARRGQGAEGHAEAARAAGREVRGQGRRAHRDDRAADPELSKFHGLARSLMANAVEGVTERLQEGARHRRRRLPRRGEGQAGGVRARLLASGRVRHPAGHRRRDRQADARHRDGHRPAARRPGRGEHPPACASRIRTSRRACGTRAKC